MSTILSVRLGEKTKRDLEALARHARRSKSFLAAEAITAFVEAERWQLAEIERAAAQLDQGHAVPHDEVASWLRSWGKKREHKAPRV